jgi:hypothetical protein
MEGAFRLEISCPSADGSPDRAMEASRFGHARRVFAAGFASTIFPFVGSPEN